ncbi:MAG: CoA pyrophosphatase [Chryseolinea sp.]
MTLVEIESLIALRLTQPLPASLAHDRMRATSLGALRPKYDNSLPPRPGAVLILLYEDHGVIKFPLIRRPEYLGVHSGQVSLPGGRTESDEGPVETALRETEEEIGIRRDSPKVLGVLSNFLVIPSNYIITPVVATLSGSPTFVPDAREVAGVLAASIDELVHDESIRESEILVSGQYRLMAPHFNVENSTVWGATAMVLNEFRSVLRDVIARHA